MASASPRRHELLTKIGIKPIVCTADIDESFPPGRDDFETLCGQLAGRKIEAVLQRPSVQAYRWFMGADTIVLKDGRVLGKPTDRNAAREYIALLAGAVHKVITGVAVYDRESSRFHFGSETAEVRLAKMTETEIEWYLDTGEWQGVAGGYRIQEKGAFFIESISGTYTNVMGLPLRLIYEILNNNNYPLGIKSSGNAAPVRTSSF